MLGLGRSAMLRGPLPQLRHDLLVQIPDDQLSHAINDRTRGPDTTLRTTSAPRRAMRVRAWVRSYSVAAIRLAPTQRFDQYELVSFSTRTTPRELGAWTNSSPPMAMPTCEAPRLTVSKKTRSP